MSKEDYRKHRFASWIMAIAVIGLLAFLFSYPFEIILRKLIDFFK